MKLVLLICVLLFNSIETRNYRQTDEAKTDRKHFSNERTIEIESEESTEKNQVSDKLRNDTIRSSIKTQHPSRELTTKNHPMPIPRKVNQRGPSYVPTTRRPLMRTTKFTTKPHDVYYAPSNEPHNFSKRRNSNSRKRFRPQNERKNIQNKLDTTDNANDRFKDFTDIDELQQNKRYVPSIRVYSLTPAASKKFTVRTLPNKNNAIDNMFRSKAQLAIQESLQKIKSIRPGTNEKVIIINYGSTSDEKSTKGFTLHDSKQNIGSSNSTTNKSLVIATEKTVSSPGATEKLEKSDVIIRKPEDSVTVKEKTQYITTTEKSAYTVVKSDTSISTAIPTEKSEVINKPFSLETAGSNKLMLLKGQISASTEISPMTTENNVIITPDLQQLITRRKRANNIIEEEPIATTAGFKTNEREVPIIADFTYRNIHT